MLEWFRSLFASNADIIRRLTRMERIMSQNQDKIDSLSGQLETATVGIRQDIADLKAQPGAETLDFSALDARVASLSELDAENPAAPVDPEPVDPDGPTEG